MVVAPSLCLLAVDGDALAHLRKGVEVLVFDLADATKALAQFEHSSEVVAFDLLVLNRP